MCIRDRVGTNIELYQANLEDRVIVLQKPSQIFEGSVYGFYPYDSRITLNGITGVFVVSGWEWDTVRNTIESTFYEVHWGNAVLSNTDYTKRVNYGEITEPTIRG